MPRSRRGVFLLENRGVGHQECQEVLEEFERWGRRSSREENRAVAKIVPVDGRMRREKKKDKMVGVDSPLQRPGTSGNGVSSSYPTVRPSKPSYNACPPPANLYPNPPFPTGNGADGASLSGNLSDGEKKFRRRPGRKLRQVADSSAYPLCFSDSSVSAGDLEGSFSSDQLAMESKKQLYGASHQPGPSPSSMPNPSFRAKPVPEISDPLLVSKSIIISASMNVDKIGAELITGRSDVRSDQYNNHLSKPSTFLTSPLDASCTAVEIGGEQKAKNKETPPVGNSKSKSKDATKPVQCSGGPLAKRKDSLSVDAKKFSQKGWRMCIPPGTISRDRLGDLDVPANSGISCPRGDSVEVLSPSSENSSGAVVRSASWPEASVLGATATPDKFCSGSTGATYGWSMDRSSQFREHLSLEDAGLCIEEGHAFRGVLRVNTYFRSEAYVTVDSVSIDILIDGLAAQNRAMEGDVVAIQLNPASQWPRLKGVNNKQSGSPGIDTTRVSLSNSADHVLGPDNQAVGTVGNSSVINSELSVDHGVQWTSVSSDGGVSVQSNDVVCQGSCVAETNGTHNSHAVNLHLTGSTKNGAKSDAGKFATAKGLLNLGALIESHPGKRPTGRVVSILGKSKRREAVIGFLEIPGNNVGRKGLGNGNDSPQKTGKRALGKGGGIVTFTPVDSRFSKMAVFGSGIPEQLSKRLKDGDPKVSNELVVAQVEEWKADSALPRALVKQSLGPGGTIEAQTEAILLENAIHSAYFPLSVMACLPNIPWKIPEKELRERRDFRGLRLFTVDPPTAKDLDDALSVEQLDSGNVRIGVHIADVAYFVHPDSALDKEAQSRSTSVYLIERVLPMLPPLLCEELCSLNPGVDRLALSVMWIMDPAGNILDQWMGRTIICSCAKLTYGHAQSMIEDPSFAIGDLNCKDTNGAPLPLLHGQQTWQEVSNDVRTLHEAAKRRRESRFDAGALKLENSSLVFNLDEDGEPYDSMVYEHQDSNILVEEFMLLANITVARVISSVFPERSLLRRHPEPNGRKMKEFEEFCVKYGFDLDASSSGALHLSLQKMREKFLDDPVLFNILMLYATKPMQLAKYFCTGDLKDQEDEWGHYALAVPIYTHFTSPIRRYPDLVVHRTLAAVLEAERKLTTDCLALSKKESPVIFASSKCFPSSSRQTVEKHIWGTEAGQKALEVAAANHKVPNIADLSSVAAHCNERRLARRHVKEGIDRLYLWSMIRKKQGVLSNARVLALGPKFISIYVCKIAMERRIYYDEIEGLNAEWFEATGTLVLSLSSEMVSRKTYGQGRGRLKRTVADVALIVNPTVSTSSNCEEDTYENLIREVEDRIAGKIISEDEYLDENKDGCGSDVVVEPAVLPMTLRWFSSLPVSIHAVGGYNRPLDIAVRLYVSSYAV